MTVPLDRHYELELHASEERAPQVRRIVAAHLRHWRLDLHIRAVCRGIDELLTNVRRHVGEGARCVVQLRWSGCHLTASVEDAGESLPHLFGAGGGGLARVADLSDSWGTCATADGKVVWFTLSVEAPLSVPRVPYVPITAVDTALQPSVAPRTSGTRADTPTTGEAADGAPPRVPTPA